MATPADAYNDLLKVTLDNYRGKLVDNLFKQNVLAWLLTKKAGKVRMIGGGEQIVEHLLTGENDDVDSYAEWAQVDITPQAGIDVAKFDWGTLVGTIAISGLEEAKNQGEAQILSLLKARTMQTEKTLQRTLNQLLWGISAITGSFGSVLDLIGEGTVGGINPATSGNEFWKSPVHTTVNTVMNYDQLVAKLTNLYNTASDGTDVVNALVGDQRTFEMYEIGLHPSVRYEDKESANAGFRNLSFKGVPFHWDKAAPVGTVIGVNTEYLNVVGHKDRWFKQSPFTASPIDGAAGGAKWMDARFSVISTFGQVTVNDRSKHFKLTNVGNAA